MSWIDADVFAGVALSLTARRKSTSPQISRFGLTQPLAGRKLETRGISPEIRRRTGNLMTTTIQVVGTIATDPKLINPASGTQLCSFRLASDERRYDREKKEWVDGDTNWFGVVSFRGLAGHAHESFRKGCLLYTSRCV